MNLRKITSVGCHRRNVGIKEACGERLLLPNALRKAMYPLSNLWHKNGFYKFMKNTYSRLARVNWTILAWAVGVPLPIVAIIALMRGCS